MGEPGASLGQNLDFLRIKMDAMRQDALRAEDAVLVQAVNHAQARFLQAIPLVLGGFGGVDVEAGSFGDGRAAAIQCFSG